MIDVLETVAVIGLFLGLVFVLPAYIITGPWGRAHRRPVPDAVGERDELASLRAEVQDLRRSVEILESMVADRDDGRR